MKRHSGNTLSEYALVLGLVVVVSIAGVSLMGGSLSNLLGDTSSAIGQATVQNMMQLGFAPATATATADPSIASGNAPDSGTSTGSGSMAESGQVGADPNGQPVLGISGGSASSTNATSIEGNQQSISATYGSIRAIAQLTALADNLPNGSAKEWLTIDLIPRTRYMAAAEGYAAGIGSFTSQIPNYSKDAAIADSNNFQAELQSKLQDPSYNDGQDKTANVPPAVMQQVRTILQPAIQSAQQMVAQVSPNTPVASPAGLDWSTSLLPALGGDSPTNFPANDTIVTSSITQAKANQSLYQSSSATTSVNSADNLTQTAASLPSPAASP